MEAALPTGG